MANLPNGARPRARSWSDTGEAPRPPSRRGRLLAVALVLLALAAVLLVLVLLPRTLGEPFLLSFPVTEYEAPQLPVNAYARADSDALRQVFRNSQPLADSQTRHLLETDLDALRTNTAETVLVHLSALARADERGVYLLPGDAEADNPARWLSLERVLAALYACPARHKVLLLDVQRGGLGPHIGLLADQVGEPLFAALNEAVRRDPALWVLCPCSAGQTSLTSDELGQSVFVHYLVRGLQGPADGYNSESRLDKRVSLRELSQFLAVHVDRWARQNRGVGQVPVLFGSDRPAEADVILVPVRSEAVAEEPELTATPYPRWLLGGWELRDAWADDTLAVAPATYAALEASLLRAEQRWRGRNVPEAEVEKEFGNDRKALEKQAKDAHGAVPRPDRPHSLALAAALGEKLPEAKEVETLREQARKAWVASRSKDPKAREEFLAKLEEARKPYLARPFALAWVAFEAAADDVDLDPVRMRFYTDDWLKPAGRAAFFAETETLKRFAEVQPDPKTAAWPKDAIHLALRAARLAERVAACQTRREKVGSTLRCEPRALVWVRAGLPEADRRRRRSEQLLTGPPAKWPDAVPLLERATDEYETLRNLVEAAAAAERTRDEALAILPPYAAYQMTRPRPDERDDAAWFRAVEATSSLAEFLDGTASRPAANEAADELMKRIHRVRDPLDELRLRLLREQVDVAPAVARSSPLRLLEADLLLQTSILPAPKRETLWKGSRELGVVLQKDTAGRDREDARATHRQLSAPRGGDGGPGAVEYLRRFRFLLGLLKLGGREGVVQLEKQEPKDAAGRHAFALRLREETTKAVEKQLRRLLSERRFREADRLERVVHPFERHVLQPIASTGVRPALELRRIEARALWTSLGERCRDEAGALAGHSSADFYSRAAEDYLHYAR